MVFLRPSFGACAPPSPNSARNLYFLRRVGRLLMIILPSGILSRRSAPLSPKGKAVIGAVCHSPRRGKQLSTPRVTLPEGESGYRHRVSLSPKGKAFLPSVKTFFLSDSLKTSRKTFYLFDSIKNAREDFFSSTQSKRAGRLSIFRLNQNEQEDFQ